MADREALERELGEAEERLRDLTEVVAKRDCSGRTQGPPVRPEHLQEIDDLEQRIAHLRDQLAD